VTPTDDFAVFYDSVFARLVGQLRIVTGELQDAEDVVQETLARASMRWTWLRAYDAPEAWVRRVGVGPAPPEPTAAGRAAPARPTGAHAGGAGRGPGAAGGAAGPVGWQRQVLVLHYRVAMPVQEVARTLGVPSGTVKVRLARGRSALAAQLGDQHKEVRPRHD
jgi:RNA polymerase sigma-70 factor, ECF subfamily